MNVEGLQLGFLIFKVYFWIFKFDCFEAVLMAGFKCLERSFFWSVVQNIFHPNVHIHFNSVWLPFKLLLILIFADIFYSPAAGSLDFY